MIVTITGRYNLFIIVQVLLSREVNFKRSIKLLISPEEIEINERLWAELGRV